MPVRAAQARISAALGVAGGRGVAGPASWDTHDDLADGPIVTAADTSLCDVGQPPSAARRSDGQLLSLPARLSHPGGVTHAAKRAGGWVEYQSLATLRACQVRGAKPDERTNSGTAVGGPADGPQTPYQSGHEPVPDGYGAPAPGYTPPPATKRGLSGRVIGVVAAIVLVVAGIVVFAVTRGGDSAAPGVGGPADLRSQASPSSAAVSNGGEIIAYRGAHITNAATFLGQIDQQWRASIAQLEVSQTNVADDARCYYGLAAGEFADAAVWGLSAAPAVTTGGYGTGSRCRHHLSTRCRPPTVYPGAAGRRLPRATPLVARLGPRRLSAFPDNGEFDELADERYEKTN